MKEKKEFNRSICFTFFEDYRLTAKELEDDFGKEVVADYYNAIIDYALYGIEPELKGALKYVWHTTKKSIDKSIERRASGFCRENVEQTESIKKYKEEHPESSQRQIAEALGVSVGKVNKVLKGVHDSVNTVNSVNTIEEDNDNKEYIEDKSASYSTSNSNSTSNSYSNSTSTSTREREREHYREHDSHSHEELASPEKEYSFGVASKEKNNIDIDDILKAWENGSDNVAPVFADKYAKAHNIDSESVLKVILDKYFN